MTASQEGNIKLVNTSLLGCPFISDSEQSQHLELLAYTLPVCLLLLCNFVFSIWIMAVSLTPAQIYIFLWLRGEGGEREFNWKGEISLKNIF